MLHKIWEQFLLSGLKRRFAFDGRTLGAAIGREAGRLKENLFLALAKQKNLAEEGARLSQVDHQSSAWDPRTCASPLQHLDVWMLCSRGNTNLPRLS